MPPVSTQQFIDLDEKHLSMSCPIQLAKYIVELRGEIQEYEDGWIEEDDIGEFLSDNPHIVEDYLQDDGEIAVDEDEYNKLKEDNSRMYKKCDDLNGLLGEDIVSMKKEKDKYYIDYMNSKMEIKKLNEEIKQLNEQAYYHCEEIKEIREKNMDLTEGHKLIYNSLKAAEGGCELMTGPEYDCVAESVNHYIHEFHKQQEEIDKLNMEKDEEDKWLKAFNKVKDENEKLKAANERLIEKITTAMGCGIMLDDDL